MENKKIIIIVQARYGSTRFPGKIFQNIDKKKRIIDLILERLNKSKLCDEVVLAAPKSEEKKFRNQIKKIKFFFGSMNDVLDRYYKAAKKFKATTIVRICGDCPFVDPFLLDEMIKNFIKEKPDYLSNTIEPTFPDGLDIEIVSFKALSSAWKLSKSTIDREHVTQFIIKNNSFKKINYKSNFSLQNLRLTIDEKKDLDKLKNIYSLLKKNKNFSIADINKLYLKDKKIFFDNFETKRNEGLYLNKGQKLWKRAKNIIPGGNTLLSKRPEMFLPDLWPVYFSRAKDCYIWDLENKKYLDMSLMSVGTNLLGYSNEKVNQAVIHSIKNGNMSSLNCYEEIQLAEKLIKMHKGLDMVRFAKTGGEANAIAIRIARSASKRTNIAICGYHGWHDWYLSANHNQIKKNDTLKNHLLPGLSVSGVPKNLRNTVFPFEFNDFNSLAKICRLKNIGIIKMEVFRNIKPKKNFLQKVRRLADKNNIVLIFDECTSGFRETFGGLHLKYNVIPDICILGKALGNGYPVTAILGKRKIMDFAQSSFISSTFWGEKTGFVAALETLNQMEKKKSWKIISKKGEETKKNILRIAKKNKLKLLTFGLKSCPGFLIVSKKNDWLKYKTFISKIMLENRILASNLIYFSIYHKSEHIKKYLKVLNLAFSIISKCERGISNIDQFLDTPICHSGFKRLN
jgi:glutamate-1-semialdehyde 2,1-aminomutase